MRIKILNLPRVKGFVWTEVATGASLLIGIGFSLLPF